MEIKPSRIFKFAYCLGLIGFIFVGVFASSSWIGLAFGGGIFRAGLIIPDIALLLIGFRIVTVAFNPTALDVYVNSRFFKFTRSTGVFLIYVGLLAMIGMFLIKPITLLIFSNVGDDGIAYFVVGIYLVLLACLAIPGFIVFEVTRLVGSRSRKNLVSTNAAGVMPLAGDQPAGYSRNLRKAIILLFLCWLGLNAAAPFYFHRQAEISKLHAKQFRDRLDMSMHPLPNPQLDAATQKNLNAELNAKKVDATIKLVTRSPEKYSAVDYAKAHGTWTQVAWLSNSCKGVINTIEGLRRHFDDGSWQLVGFQLDLSNGYKVPIQQPMISKYQAPAQLQNVTCTQDTIYTFKRQDKHSLVIHRFKKSGEVIDALRVSLPETDNDSKKQWGDIWEIIPTAENITILLVNYENDYPSTVGGIINSKQYFVVNLPK